MKALQVIGNAVSTPLFAVAGALLIVVALRSVYADLDDQEDQLFLAAASTEEALQRVNQLDEILTASATLYATTGGAEYKNRYEVHAAENDEVFAGLVQTLGDQRFKEMVVGLDAVNEQLVNAELRAFNLKEKNAPEAAMAVLRDDAYRALKQAYADLANQALLRARTVVKERLDFVQRRMTLASLGAVIVFCVLGLTVVVVVLKSKRQLAIEHAQLRSSRDALAAEIDEHQKTERELVCMTDDLRASESRHRSVLQGALDAVVTLDSKERIVEWNTQAEHCFGWLRAEVLGRSLAETLFSFDEHEEQAAKTQRFLMSTNGHLAGHRVEVNAVRKDRTEIPIELSVTATDLAGDKLYTAFIRDITTRKAAEAEIRRHRDHLQELVDSRTCDLVAAKEAAEQANQAKGQFLANMSHEIRTPMNAIIGLSHLALKDQLSAKQRDYLEKIHASGSSLLILLNDILDFAKVEAGKLDLDVDEFALDTVISRVTAVIGYKVREKNLGLIVDVAPSVPARLVGDASRLQQILVNLVSNAVKFTEQGEVRVKVSIDSSEADAVVVRFEVRDTGIGMSPEQRERLFQPFYQADASHTRKYGGTGLGLSICQRLVALMDGTIEVDSHLGLGSRISFTVRLGIGCNDQRLDQRLPIALRNLHALVVDDNSACADVIKEMLTVLGYETSTADSADKALQFLTAAETPFDIVFMDWNMPQLNGIDASRQIRMSEDLQRQPAIVIVTAYDQPEVRADASTADVNGYLVKPVSASMLVDALVEIFAPKSSDASGSNTHTGSAPRELEDVRILLVEDNSINQQIATELLEEWGAKVEVAEDGSVALTKLKGAGPHYFNLVLMDIQMPVMDGYEAVRRIRQQAVYDALPVIAMTAHALVQERQRCIDIGMNDYVSKPIEPQQLLQTVLRWCEWGITQSASRDNAKDAVTEIPAGAVDLSRALRRLNGRDKLLEKVVQQVVDTYSDGAAELQKMLTEGELEQAGRYAHTMAGMLGYVGATQAQLLASTLETSIRSEPEAIADALEKLEAQHGQVISDLKQWLNDPTRRAA